MWRNTNGGIYLEPGEIQVLSDLVHCAVPVGPVTHPSALLMKAVAVALSELVEGAGVMIEPAPAVAARTAAESYLLATGGRPLRLA